MDADYWERIIRAGLDSASSMEGALFFVQSGKRGCELWELRQIAAVDNLHKDLRMQDQIAEKVQVRSKKVIHIEKNGFKAKSDL